MVAIIDGAPPLYGRCSVCLLMPATLTNIATAKWLVEPTPPDAYFSVPGAFFASAIRSCTFFTGRSRD